MDSGSWNERSHARGRDCHNSTHTLMTGRLSTTHLAVEGSRIDFVCMPQELFEAVSHAGICEGAGRRLQLVNVRRLFDHVQVQVSLSYSLDHTGFSQAAEERLNRDQLKRVELVQAVASELGSLREELDRQFKEKTPDAIVLTFTSPLMKAAKVVFGVMQGRRTAAQKAEAKQLPALLRQRRALRQRLDGCSEGMDLALTMEIVRLSRQLRRTARA